MRHVHFVGSIPFTSAEEVYRNCCPVLSKHLARIPDGETGVRSQYVAALGKTLYAPHPDIETVQRPDPLDPDNPEEWRGPDQDWLPLRSDASDMWKFRLRKGVNKLHLDSLGYADAALASWQVFQRCREEGVIPEGVRFQVSLPSVIDGIGPFMSRFSDMRDFMPAYEQAMAADIKRILQVIPADQLAIQWDNVSSVLEHETQFTGQKADMPVKIPPYVKLLMGKPTGRFLKLLQTFTANVPDAVEFGLHFCYGDIGHKHALEPVDLAPCVHMANEAVAHLDRRIDWVHMPVPRSRTDDAFYQPLRDLTLDTKLVLGLVHLNGGLAATRERMQVAARYREDFDIATECGWGRRDPATLPDLLQLHKSAATLSLT